MAYQYVTGPVRINYVSAKITKNILSVICTHMVDFRMPDHMYDSNQVIEIFQVLIIGSPNS